MTENQFWWADLHGHDRDEVVEVTIEGRKPVLVHITGTDIGIAAHDFDRNQVRLIERVLPAGRAKAAVEKLQEAFDTRCGEDIWGVVQEAIAILQGEKAARL